MRRPITPPPQAATAVEILGRRIRAARVERGWTLAQAAEAVRVSRPTMSAIESGSPSTSIGTVFTAACLLGVPLFGTDDPAELARMRRDGERLDALLPRRVRTAQVEPDDDF